MSELKKEQINKLEKILELIADNPTADEVAEIVQGLLKQIKLLREDTEREHSKIKKETNETINSLWNSFTKNLKNLEDKLKELNNKSEKEKVRLQTNFFEGLNKEIKAIERKIPDLRPLQKELENKLQNEIKNLKGEIEGIDLIKEINSSDGGIDKEKIKGLSDELKRIEKKSVGGGTRGIQLYTGGEKRGMAQMMNLIAGTGVTLNHDYASGRNDITINSLGGGGGMSRSIFTTSGNTTAGAVALTDYVYFVAGNHTITMPTAVGNTNRYTIKNNHTANIIINTTSSQTIDGTLSIEIAPWESVDLVSNNSNWGVV